MTESDPVDPHELAFFASVGRLAVTWAFLETNIDMIVTVTYREAGGDQIEDEMPRALKRKLRYLTKVFTSSAQLADFRRRVMPILKVVAKESNVRHDIIHGSVKSLPSAWKDGIAMSRLIREGDLIRERPFTVTPEDVNEASYRALTLARELLSVAQDLLERFSRM